jgi:NTP pyrophosphatase (non-canonical NTP hydrolase)
MDGRVKGIKEFQRAIEEIYFDRDSRRGVEGTFVWFVEEVGELAKEIRKRDRDRLLEEFGDVFAWLSTLASLLEIDLEEAAQRYAHGCPKCGQKPCQC